MVSNIVDYEKKLWDEGVEYIAGVDEAGRGPLAGPLVSAAVILDKNHITNNDIDDLYMQINDSKLVSPIKRLKLYRFIVQNAVTLTVEVIPSDQIDVVGIGKCNQIAFFNCVNRLKIPAQHVLTDHYEIFGIPTHTQTNIPKGDSKSISIAAASIIAKVYRDKLMEKMHLMYPRYRFDKHKGYGTKLHKEMIQKHGKCEFHRKSFKLN